MASAAGPAGAVVLAELLGFRPAPEPPLRVRITSAKPRVDFGRLAATADIAVPDPRVSSKHCHVTVDAESGAATLHDALEAVLPKVPQLPCRVLDPFQQGIARPLGEPFPTP